MRPIATKLFPFLFLSFREVSDFFRLVSEASDRRKSVPLPVPPFFRNFPDFSTFSGVFRMLPAVANLFSFLFLSFPDFSGFSDFFRRVPDASRRDKIVPLHLPLISGFFRIFRLFPTCSGCVLL